MKYLLNLYKKNAIYHNDYVPVHKYCSNSISGNCVSIVMVSVLVWRAVDYGFKPRSGQTRHIKLVFVVSRLSTQY